METQPALVIDHLDYDRLAGLASAVAGRLPMAARDLAHELDRATIVPAAEIPVGTVRMHSTVRFRDDTTGTEQELRLVYPGEADIEAGRISILTPVGTALIGLGEGQSIAWYTRSGERRRLTVLRVTRAECPA